MTMKLKEKRCIKDKIETRVVSFQFISSDFSSSILRTLICILKPINIGYLCLQGIGILSTPSRLTGFHYKYANWAALCFSKILKLNSLICLFSLTLNAQYPERFLQHSYKILGLLTKSIE